MKDAFSVIRWDCSWRKSKWSWTQCRSCLFSSIACSFRKLARTFRFFQFCNLKISSLYQISYADTIFKDPLRFRRFPLNHLLAHQQCPIGSRRRITDLCSATRRWNLWAFDGLTSNEETKMVEVSISELYQGVLSTKNFSVTSFDIEKPAWFDAARWALYIFNSIEKIFNSWPWVHEVSVFAGRITWRLGWSYFHESQ